MAPIDPWPLTAAATAYLRAVGKMSGSDVLKLSLKELVLRRAWRLERRERAGVLRSREQLVIVPGGVAVDPALVPLSELDERLRTLAGPDGEPVQRAVRRLTGWRGDLPGRLRDAVHEDLAARDLVRRERSKLIGLVPRTRVRLTPAGEALVAGSHEREDAVRAALADRRDPAAQLGLILGASGIALVAYPSLLPEIEAVYDELRQGDGGATAPGEVGPESGEEGLAAFTPDFDSAIDAGGGGFGGDGGDGGGGDGGGGGGG